MFAYRGSHRIRATLKVFERSGNLQLSRNVYYFCLFKCYLQYRKHLALGKLIANLYIILIFSLEKLRFGGLSCLSAEEGFALKHRSDRLAKMLVQPWFTIKFPRIQSQHLNFV